MLSLCLLLLLLSPLLLSLSLLLLLSLCLLLLKPLLHGLQCHIELPVHTPSTAPSRVLEQLAMAACDNGSH